MATALEEIEYAKTGPHDYIIVNDDIESAYTAFQLVALGKEGADLQNLAALRETLPPLDT